MKLYIVRDERGILNIPAFSGEMMSNTEFDIWQSTYLRMMNDKLKMNDKKNLMDMKYSLQDLYNERSIMWKDLLEEEAAGTRSQRTDSDDGGYKNPNRQQL